MAKRFELHKYVERLKPEETMLVRERTNNLVLPRNIMSMLMNKSSTTINHIYNVHYIYKTPAEVKDYRCTTVEVFGL
jgi:hypothetical protein